MNNNTTYKDSPMGKIPSDWEVKRLKEILIEGRLGGNYENAEANNGIPVIKMGNLDRGVIKIDKVQYLPEDNEYNEEDVLKENDLLFNTRNTLELVGKVAIWKNELPFAVYNSNLMRMKFAEKWVQLNSYMNYAFNSHYALSQLKGRATGTTSVAAIYGRDLDSVKFLLPPLPEQARIAEVLSAWDKAISNVQATIVQVELRNKWLMQELLSGKRRLKGFGGEWKSYS
jgi:type I restriction enzyme S subunit